MNWRLGVVGSPIEHSLSPQLHEAGLRLAGLEGSSVRVKLERHEAGRLRDLLGAEFDALSVTMPLKEVALDICDALDPVAERVGVVNSLLARGGEVEGASTDGPGFVAALEGQFGVSPEGWVVHVLGAGGAARGIVDALIEAGAAQILVQGRTVANVERLAQRYERVMPAHPVERLDLVVNTIPAHERTGVANPRGVNRDTVAVDVTYEPRLSAWRAHYEELGCRSANGLAMLAHQAALQMRWWWGVDLDGAALLEAVS
jgi:shikimate dehydrogenase